MPDPGDVWARLVGAGQHQGVGIADDAPDLDDVRAFIEYVQAALASLPDEARGHVHCEWTFGDGSYLMWSPLEDAYAILGLEVTWEEETEDPRDVYGRDWNYERSHEGWAEEVKAWLRGEVEYLHAGVREADQGGYLSSLGMISLWVSPTGRRKKQQDAYRADVESDLLQEAYGYLVGAAAGGGPPEEVELETSHPGVYRGTHVWATSCGVLTAAQSAAEDPELPHLLQPAEPAYVAHAVMPRGVWDDVSSSSQWTWPLGKKGQVRRAQKERPSQSYVWWFVGAPHPAWVDTEGRVDKKAMGYWLGDEWRRRLHLDVEENPWAEPHVRVLRLAKDITVPSRQNIGVTVNFFPFKPIGGNTQRFIEHARNPEVTEAEARRMKRQWEREFPAVAKHFKMLRVKRTKRGSK